MPPLKETCKAEAAIQGEFVSEEPVVRESEPQKSNVSSSASIDDGPFRRNGRRGDNATRHACVNGGKTQRSVSAELRTSWRTSRFPIWALKTQCCVEAAVTAPRRDPPVQAEDESAQTFTSFNMSRDAARVIQDAVGPLGVLPICSGGHPRLFYDLKTQQHALST
ncbi:hypothetical protein SISNIDRAFT_471790 [Sistotremastrum niveocremeum HHB9708]|uniref:Uncharacterized protein n=1 Tax=Sistotremastrum niveocremeum HHB9708 TaxID=1314777 RepID=A0A164M7F3_9AGAM|nr:hypothetical protein SISNIDRAFT_471790 [Sistotremastrum niveocremeum HHB9708]